MAKKKTDETYLLNIYKLRGVSSLDDLFGTFDYEIANNNKFHKNKERLELDTIELEGVSILYFAYKNQVQGKDVEWFAKWKNFFQSDKTMRIASVTGHGLLIFHITDSDEYYAVTFGRSFSFIKHIIDPEYGMNMAGILFDGKAMDTISSKYFSITANKAVMTYNGEQAFSFKDGEAFDILKASIVEHPFESTLTELLKLIQNPTTIGFANVKITAKQKVVELDTITQIIKLLSKIEQTYTHRFKFPKMQFVKNPVKIDELNTKLLESLKDEDSSVLLSVPFYSKDSADNLVFLDSIVGSTLRFGRAEQTNEGFRFADVLNFIKAQNVDDITRVRVDIDSGGFVEPSILTNWIDAHIELDGDDYSYALNNGKWVTFNDTYAETINNRVSVIEQSRKIAKVDSSYDVSKSTLQQYYTDNKSDILTIFNGATGTATDISEDYIEIRYNHRLSKQNGYYLFDRNLFDGVEVCDLYDPTAKSLIHVKAGTTAKLEECLRQSFLATKHFHRNKNSVIDLANSSGQKIGDVDNIVVLYLLKGKTARDKYSLSAIKSLKCKSTLLSWMDAIETMKYKPQIIVANFIDDSPVP